MLIKLKNKDKLIIDHFKLRCCIGKSGVKSNKKEGDKSTPSGIFHLGDVYYRPDRVKKPLTKLKQRIQPHLFSGKKNYDCNFTS